jgi:hypothetical protein
MAVVILSFNWLLTINEILKNCVLINFEICLIFKVLIRTKILLLLFFRRTLLKWVFLLKNCQPIILYWRIFGNWNLRTVLFDWTWLHLKNAWLMVLNSFIVNYLFLLFLITFWSYVRTFCVYFLIDSYFVLQTIFKCNTYCWFRLCVLQLAKFLYAVWRWLIVAEDLGNVLLDQNLIYVVQVYCKCILRLFFAKYVLILSLGNELFLFIEIVLISGKVW